MRKLSNEHDSGLCKYCGKILDRRGSHCVACNKIHNTWKRKRSLRNLEQGKCINCYNPMDRDGWFCTACANDSELKERIRVVELKAKSE